MQRLGFDYLPFIHKVYFGDCSHICWDDLIQRVAIHSCGGCLVTLFLLLLLLSFEVSKTK